MAVEVRPPLPAPEREALIRALAEAGVELDGAPAAYRSAWRLEGLVEATAGDEEASGYARSPRRTPGATRA